MLRLSGAAILVASLAILAAYAQGSGEVAGRYKNARTGWIIYLPQDWTGTDGLGFPIVSPEGMVPGGKLSAVNMAIMSTSMLKAKEIWQGPEYRYSLADDMACRELAGNYVLVARVRASEVVKECDGDDEYSKIKTYAIATVTTSSSSGSVQNPAATTTLTLPRLKNQSERFRFTRR